MKNNSTVSQNLWEIEAVLTGKFITINTLKPQMYNQTVYLKHLQNQEQTIPKIRRKEKDQNINEIESKISAKDQ